MPAIYRNGNLWILDLSILLTNITLRGSQPFSDVRCNGLKQPTSRDFLRYPTWWFLLYHFISISSTRCGYFWEYIINILPGMVSLKIFLLHHHTQMVQQMSVLSRTRLLPPLISTTTVSWAQPSWGTHGFGRRQGHWDIFEKKKSLEQWDSRWFKHNIVGVCAKWTTGD